MISNIKPARIKQRRIQNLIKNSDSYSFFNLLTGPEMLSMVEQLLPDEHRERQFPPTETLPMFLAQAMSEDRSCQKAVIDAAVKRTVGGLSPCSTATGGYCHKTRKIRVRDEWHLVKPKLFRMAMFSNFISNLFSVFH